MTTNNENVERIIEIEFYYRRITMRKVVDETNILCEPISAFFYTKPLAVNLLWTVRGFNVTISLNYTNTNMRILTLNRMDPFILQNSTLDSNQTRPIFTLVQYWHKITFMTNCKICNFHCVWFTGSISSNRIRKTKYKNKVTIIGTD